MAQQSEGQDLPELCDKHRQCILYHRVSIHYVSEQVLVMQFPREDKSFQVVNLLQIVDIFTDILKFNTEDQKKIIVYLSIPLQLTGLSSVLLKAILRGLELHLVLYEWHTARSLCSQ